RDIGSICRVVRRASAEHVDIAFKYISYVEVSLADHDPNGMKELNEKRLKIPETMRSFCSRILEQYETNPVGIDIAGIIISSAIISKTVTLNNGSVGLIYISSGLKMLKSIVQVSRLLPPILTLIYKCSQSYKRKSQTFGGHL
ncbi:MAG: hypothetical protein EXX96DRAFT_473326, partial [Benjaminiella poitrasii]